MDKVDHATDHLLHRETKITDRVKLSIGDPGSVVRLVAEWERQGLVVWASDAREWRYSSTGRDKAKTNAGDLVRLVLWRLLGDDSAMFATSCSVLRTAALAGSQFTIEPLADVLGRDVVALGHWIDTYLVAARGHRAGLLERDPAGTSSYRFTSRLVWTVLHPVYGKDQWPDHYPVQETAERYARALAHAHADDLAPIARSIAAMYQLAGQPDLARHFGRIVNTEGCYDSYRETIRFERAAYATTMATSRTHTTADQRQRMRSAAQRVEAAARGLEGTSTDRQDLVGYELAWGFHVR